MFIYINLILFLVIVLGIIAAAFAPVIVIFFLFLKGIIPTWLFCLGCIWAFFACITITYNQ